jgi:hypothetical protein
MISGPGRQVHRQFAGRLQEGRAPPPDDARHRRLAERQGHGRSGGLLRKARRFVGQDRGRHAGRAAFGRSGRAADQGRLRFLPRRQLQQAHRPELPQDRRPARRLPYVALQAYAVEGNPNVGRGNAIMAGQVKQFKPASSSCWPAISARCRANCARCRSPSSAKPSATCCSTATVFGGWPFCLGWPGQHAGGQRGAQQDHSAADEHAQGGTSATKSQPHTMAKPGIRKVTEIAVVTPVCAIRRKYKT